VDHDE
jgi:hypothetical protein